MARIFYGWWVVLACFLITLYRSGALSYGFTAFFEPIVEEFGWSYTQVSIAFSLRGLEMGILAPIMGFLVDRTVWLEKAGILRGAYNRLWAYPSRSDQPSFCVL